MENEIIQTVNAVSGFQVLQLILTFLGPFVGIIIGYKISRSISKKEFKMKLYREIFNCTIDYLRGFKELQNAMVVVKALLHEYFPVSKGRDFPLNDFQKFADELNIMRSKIPLPDSAPKKPIDDIFREINFVTGYDFRKLQFDFQFTAGKSVELVRNETARQFRALLENMIAAGKKKYKGFNIPDFVKEITPFMDHLKKYIIKKPLLHRLKEKRISRVKKKALRVQKKNTEEKFN